MGLMIESNAVDYGFRLTRAEMLQNLTRSRRGLIQMEFMTTNITPSALRGMMLGC